MSKDSQMTLDKSKELIPKLRFLEFINEGEWVEKDLEDSLDYIQPTEFLVNDTNYNDRYKTPVLTAGKTFILGYTNENEGIFQNNLPVIIFDDFTTATQFVDFPFKVKSSAIKILTAKKNTDIKFVFESIQLIRYEVGVHQRHWISIFSKLKLPTPKPKEQQKIAYCLSTLDDLIGTHKQRLDTLRLHKKGLMQNLFPQEGEKVPKLRFKEFENEGAWEEDILLSLALDGFSNGVFNDPKKIGSGYKLINVINMYSESTICENNLTLLELSDSEFEKNKVKYGDIFLTRSSLVPEGIAKSNIYLGSSENITYDGHLIRMRPKKELIYPIYLHYLLKTEYVRRQMIAKGKTATMTTIGQLDVASVKISYSKIPVEQQKIASCLFSLDALIAAQAAKIEQLKLHKKGLMQGLFPKIQD